MHIRIKDDQAIISMEKFMTDFLNHYGDLPVRAYVTPTLDSFCEIDPESEALVG